MEALLSSLEPVRELISELALSTKEGGRPESKDIFFYDPSRTDKAYASLSLEQDGDTLLLVGLTTNGKGSTTAWEYRFSDDNLIDAVERLSQFFTKQKE